MLGSQMLCLLPRSLSTKVDGLVHRQYLETRAQANELKFQNRTWVEQALAFIVSLGSRNRRRSSPVASQSRWDGAPYSMPFSVLRMQHYSSKNTEHSQEFTIVLSREV